MVKNIECADQFVVKYWMNRDPHGYKQTELLSLETFEVEIKVTPKVLYQFQVIAREEKGGWGVDYNKSQMVQFR